MNVIQNLSFLHLRGCGVVVAQEPSKLLGPVRTWSAAPTKKKFIKKMP